MAIEHDRSRRHQEGSLAVVTGGADAAADQALDISLPPPVVVNDPAPIVIVTSETVSPPPFNGVDYVADVYGSYAAASSLESLAAVNVNAVAMTADFGIDAQNSTVYQDDVAGGYTESDANVASAITSATGLGLSVVVRPLIDFLPGNYDTAPGQTNPKNGSYSASEWRTYYNPSNVATFFSSYQTMIVREATLAQANGATLFCIGTELDQLTGAAYETYWDNIITAVRAVFTGKLTYSADWDDALSPWQYGGSGLPVGTGDITTQISFWNKLDYVGIDEYAPISDLANPTLNQLIAGWTQTPTDATTLAVTGDQSLISYYQGIAATVGKPLLFTELGYANSSDADSSPATPGYDENGNADGAVADPALQANLYQAFFDAWKADGNGSLVGTYLWNWEPDAASVGPANGINFSVQGQPAQTVVKTGYAACFCRGTRIETDRGEVPVEQLHAGDNVLTVSGEKRPIVWIGHRRIDLTRHPDPALVQPIRVRAHALAEGVPRRDLLLSPDHALYIDGRLVPARLLRNDATIAREQRFRSIQYFHVELDRHDILLAEGTPAESYLDTGNRGLFENGNVPLIPHPDLAADDGQPRREALSCVPFVTDPKWIEPVWRRFARRASRLGFAMAGATTTSDPNLRLLANGRVLAPVEATHRRYVFVLPPKADAVRLLSRAAAPSGVRPWIDDSRRLGVAVRSLTWRPRRHEKSIPLDHPELRDGWWQVERDDTALWRWTDGAALLPLDGAAGLLRIELGGAMRYLMDVPPPARRLGVNR